jgi:hypothetical protein
MAQFRSIDRAELAFETARAVIVLSCASALIAASSFMPFA